MYSLVTVVHTGPLPISSSRTSSSPTTACAASPATSRARSTTSTTRSIRSRTSWPRTSRPASRCSTSTSTRKTSTTQDAPEGLRPGPLPVRGKGAQPVVQGADEDRGAAQARDRGVVPRPQPGGVGAPVTSGSGGWGQAGHREQGGTTRLRGLPAHEDRRRSGAKDQDRKSTSLNSSN